MQCCESPVTAGLTPGDAVGGCSTQQQASGATEVPNAVTVTIQTERQPRKLPDTTVQMLKRRRQVTIILAVPSARSVSD